MEEGEKFISFIYLYSLAAAFDSWFGAFKVSINI